MKHGKRISLLVDGAARQRRSEQLAAREKSEAAFRTLVEAAPGLIVILRRLQKLAMGSNRKMVDVAQMVLTADEAFQPKEIVKME